MENNLPEIGDIVKCIKSFTTTYSYNNVKTISFIKDELYTIRSKGAVHVDINNDDIITATLFTKSIYGEFIYKDYFELYKKGKLVKFYTEKRYEGKYEWNLKLKTNIITAKNNSSLKLSGMITYVKFNNLKSIKFHSIVKSVTLNGITDRLEYDHEDKDKVTLNNDNLKLHKNIKRFNIFNGYSSNNTKYHHVILKDLNYPKNIESINFLNVKTDILKSNASEIILKYSEVDELILNKDTINYISITESIIHKCNLDMFTEKINGCGTNMYVIKIDDNTFISNMSNKRSTLEEISIICNTLQLKKTIKYFNLNSKSRYNFIANYDKKDNNIFKFYSESNNIISLKMHKNNIVLFNSHTPLNDLNFTITLNDKDDIIIYCNVGWRNEDFLKLSNNIFNRLAKFSEHEQLHHLFFEDLFNHPDIGLVKNTELLDVRDFDFSLLENKENYKNIECLHFKEDKWIGLEFYKRKYYNYFNTNNVVIEWTELGFKLSTENIKEGSKYFKPGIEDYYDKIKYDKDHFNVIEDYLIYDETIKYKLKATEKLVHDENCYLYNKRIFKKHSRLDYRDNTKISLKTAEGLAFKYKLNLDHNNITYHNKEYSYEGFKHITDKCNTNREAILDMLFRYNGNLITNRKEVDRQDRPLIRIGNNLYIDYKDNHRDKEQLVLVGETKEYKYSNSDGIYIDNVKVKMCEILDLNNLEFSFVNLDISNKLRADVNNFLEEKEDFLRDILLESYNRKLVGLYYLLAYYCKDISWAFNDNYEYTKEDEDIFKSLKSELINCFEITKKRIKND